MNLFQVRIKFIFLFGSLGAYQNAHENYGPVVIDQLPFESVSFQLNGGSVKGRQIEILGKEVEVYRGIVL